MSQEYVMTCEDIAAGVGVKYGYGDIDLVFRGFTDVKLRWARGLNWISFEMSDYMAGMPEDAAEELFNTIYRNIRDGSGSMDYGPLATAWLTRPEFAEQNRPVFLARSNAVAVPMLDDVRGELIAEGLLTDADRGIPLYMRKDLGSDRDYEWSTLMRVGFVSPSAFVQGRDMLRRSVYLACRGAQLPFGTGKGRIEQELIDVADRLFCGEVSE